MNRFTAYCLSSFAIILLSVSCSKDSGGSSQPEASAAISCDVMTETTKGLVADDSGIQTSGFSMSAWLDEDYYQKGDTDTPTGKKGKQFGPSNVTYSSGTWTISGSPVWVAVDSTRFWCWAPIILTAGHGTRTINPDNVDLTGKNKLDFTYSMQPGGATSGSPAQPCDASNQEDLLFAYNCRWYQPEKAGSDSKKVNLKFYHPLTQINFIVYPLASGSQTSGDGSMRSDYKIVDIALQGILSSGKCTITGWPYYELPSSKMMSFVWSGQSTSDDFTQYYGTSFSSASSSNVPDGWTYKDYGGKAHYYCNNSFFIVPQNIGDATALAVTFQQGDAKVTKLVLLKGVGTSDGSTPVTAWLAGYRYTYRLAISGDITDPTALVVTLEDWVPVNDSMRF